MDYKQHKGNLRGQIKNDVERKLYNKRIRKEAIDVDTSEEQLTISDVSNSLSQDEEIPYCTDCGNDDLTYIDQYANGEYWRCKECGKEFIW